MVLLVHFLIKEAMTTPKSFTFLACFQNEASRRILMWAMVLTCAHPNTKRVWRCHQVPRCRNECGQRRTRSWPRTGLQVKVLTLTEIRFLQPRRFNFFHFRMASNLRNSFFSPFPLILLSFCCFFSFNSHLSLFFEADLGRIHENFLRFKFAFYEQEIIKHLE